ncbi:MAG: LarC family nickel insertion protein [Candidatus Eisenbacteria bacterium]
MRIAHLEFWSGLAGDMFVGALLDAGWPEERLREVVSALDLGSVEIEVERRTHRGLSGVGIRVRAAKDPHARHLEEILKLIDAARIPARAKETATRAFRLLGEAEAKIHGIPIERVHFHEVGAADSIVDFVATATALADLEIERVTAGAIPLTTGWVEMDHGGLRGPGPATALLLEGWPVHSVPVEGEFFTPTAAALLRAVAIPLEVTPNMQVERVGYGAGTRPHPQLPNLVRLWLGQATEGRWWSPMSCSSWKLRLTTWSRDSWRC